MYIVRERFSSERKATYAGPLCVFAGVKPGAVYHKIVEALEAASLLNGTIGRELFIVEEVEI